MGDRGSRQPYITKATVLSVDVQWFLILLDLT